MEPETARLLWTGLEHINAVTYFAAECRDAPVDLGLSGFWAGYFANRAAPMGAVAAGVVEATFFNFHPRRVRNTIPAAWVVVAPHQVVHSRTAAAAAALRRLLPDADELAADLAPILNRCVEAADGAGRPLFCANRESSLLDGSVEALWQAATTLREHRGDGHVAALTAEGLDGCEVHVLFAATARFSPALILKSRGWSEEDWAHATDRLVARGLVQPDGTATSQGAALHKSIEERTDRLAADGYRVLGEAEVHQILDATTRAARTIAATEMIPYPNPMGLPAPE